MQVTIDVTRHTDASCASRDLAVRCTNCNLRELCLPQGMAQDEVQKINGLVTTRRRVKKGESLQHAGEPFKSLYAVRSGSFKTCIATEDGRDQVTGFKMSGEIIGLDGIGTNSHIIDVIALEDSEVCAIPFSRLEEVSREIAGLQKQFHRIMSREIVGEQGVMVLLGSMRAEERVATFLVNLSRRFRARGYSATEFHLRMTREEIGSYLGLKLETVSRVMSRFHDVGLIKINQKHVLILNPEGLQEAASPSTAGH
ncbi:fumarate/nitrate reduction transcriptional regulator Fnr [Uliginosibacterium sp. H3]|uniref:Fumarate/nitrate reduction transcriptional regulator Fnr n=1 Tax=Uliginosibacterium silvisoli TaxID=3114758 RepID=A0ABU6JZQ4_9RHOO|nr:fumarate/nitrate reduction transcriptional regulator Fnr [Uliginosibacterium sp. H3]